jgi:hypothetical protein
MAATLTTIADILKTDYGPAIQEQLNNKNTLLGMLEKDFDSYDHKGKNFTFPVHVSRNEGIGSRAEGGALPTAGQQGYASAVLPDKYSYGVVQFNRQALKASESDAKAFARALSSEMKGILLDLKANQNRQMFGDGSGVLATCASCSTATFTVDTTKWIRVGQRVDVLVTSSGATSYGVVGTTVSAVNSATTFTTADAPATAGSIDNTFSVYAAGSRLAEPYGLAAIVATTDTITSGLQGLAVASYPIWKSTVTAMGGALTELAMQKLLDDISQAGNGNPDAFVTTYGVSRAYGELMTSQRMFMNNATLDGGIKAPTFAGLPIMVDKDCQAGIMYAIDKGNLVNMVLQDWGWADEDGDMLKWVSGYDAYTAYLCAYRNLGTYARNAHGKLTGITEA